MASSSMQREFAFTKQDFDRVRSLIYQHAGIRLRDSKHHMVYSRLARRLRATGKTSCGAYLAFVEQDGAEWQNFVNALTTNLTAFFREPHHFEILADYLASRTVSARSGPLNIWCAAASTGEEAYSIAMTVVDFFGSFTPAVKIFATDLDTQVLNLASQGVFSSDRAQKLPPATLKRFFLKGEGANEGRIKARPELRRMIKFSELNLLAPEWNIRGPFDAIFCRNVMIYFDKPTQYQILQRFEPLLRADGLLFAGHSESFHHASELFKPCGKTVYRHARSVPASHEPTRA